MNPTLDKKGFSPSPMRVKWLAFAKTIKPWNGFFLAKNNYALPSEKLPIERIKKNIEYFEANYIIILVPFAVLGLLGDLILLLLLLLSYFGWSYIQNHRKPSFFYDDRILSSEAKIGSLFIGNLFLIVLITGGYMFTLIGLCVSIVAIHASFIDEMHVYTASNPNEKDEENHEHFSEEHAIFDTQIINKESYGLEVLTDPEKPTGLI